MAQGWGAWGPHSRLGSPYAGRHIQAMAKSEKTQPRKSPPAPAEDPTAKPSPKANGPTQAKPVEEVGGRAGPDPTRYGDYEKDGRCVDF